MNIGGAKRRLVTRAYFDDNLQGYYNCLVQPVQNGVGVRGGISITAFGAHAALDAAPGFGVIQGDITNNSD